MNQADTATAPRRKRTALAVALAVLVGLLGPGGTAAAEDYEVVPDESFGSGGLVELPEHATVFDGVVDDMGRVLVVGATNEDDSYAFVRRLLPDGSPDPSFGAGGVVTMPGLISEIVLDREGRIVVGGSAGYTFEPELLLARLLPDGRLDPDFGDRGFVHEPDLPCGPDASGVRALAVDGDSVLAVLDPFRLGCEDRRNRLVRYDGRGRRITTFASAGAFVDSDRDFSIDDVLVGPGGHLTLAGVTKEPDAIPGQGFAGRAWRLVRLGPGGSRVPTWGDGGAVVLSPMSDDTIYDIAFDGERVVIIGTVGVSRQHATPGEFPPSRCGLGRIDGDGRLDGSFGDGGYVLTAEDFGSCHGVSVTGGRYRTSAQSYGVATFTPDGDLLERSYGPTSSLHGGVPHGAFGSGPHVYVVGAPVGADEPGVVVRHTVVPVTDWYDPDGPQGTVYRLYRAYFLREPDASGFRYWLDAYRSGYPLAAISDSFAASAEFRDRYGTAVDDRAFIRLVYVNVLGREPEPDGYAYWRERMEIDGLPRGLLMIYFSDSPEFRQRTAAGIPPR